MARLSTKKFQDLDISLRDLHVVRVEVFYRKRGNTIGEFFFESFTTDHPRHGAVFIPGATFATLKELSTYVEARIARHTPVPPSLTFVKYARKQPIVDDQLERCMNLLTLEGTPLYRNCMFMAKDKEGRIWYKLNGTDEPKMLDKESYDRQIQEFTMWDEKKEQELVELLKCAAHEQTKLKEDWLNKYRLLIKQKHDECTGVVASKSPLTSTEDSTLQEIIKTYS